MSLKGYGNHETQGMEFVLLVSCFLSASGQGPYILDKGLLETWSPQSPAKFCAVVVTTSS